MTDAIRYRLLSGGAKFVGTIGEMQFRGVVSDATVDRVGEILDPYGARTANFLRTRTILAQHDPSKPVARCVSLGIEDGQLVMLGEFPPAGTSDAADETRKLLKSGVLNAFSVGFLPIRSEPLKNGGRIYKEWELLEISIVSVPCNPSALVTEKALSRSRPDPDLARIFSQIAAVRAEAQAPRQRRQVEPEQTLAELRSELRHARRDAGYVRPDVLAAQTAFRMGRF